MIEDVKGGDKSEYKDTERGAGYYYKYKVLAYRLVNDKKEYSGESNTVTVTTKLLKPEFTEVKSEISKKARLEWENTTEKATGYKMYMATSKYGKYSYVGTSKDNIFIKSYLTSHKTYYFKVRAYRTVYSKNTYSDYSDIVKVTIR